LQSYFAKIEEMLNSFEHKHKFVAIGECGLDYDRFEYADKET
jgi:Tat protein secretion system quality control protein TatD with DNase activity